MAITLDRGWPKGMDVSNILGGNNPRPNPIHHREYSDWYSLGHVEGSILFGKHRYNRMCQSLRPFCLFNKQVEERRQGYNKRIGQLLKFPRRP